MVCACVLASARPASAEPPHRIEIDGEFDDWAAVPSRTDPVGTAFHNGIPDVHDTNHDQPGDIPGFVSHPDVDILEYKFTHDENNLYAYFRATGEIGRTQTDPPKAGRYYVIVTIDVDNDDTTGYWLHEGGYYPTSHGYDIYMGIEFYDGRFNNGRYVNHGARNQAELNQAFLDQRSGIVRVRPGSYDWHTEWVWFDDLSGEHQLPPPDDAASITFIVCQGPPYDGIVEGALSADSRELEMMGPFRGWMRHPGGTPIMKLDNTIDISFSLEASGELAPGGTWASDTAEPIIGYRLDPPPPVPTLSGRGMTAATMLLMGVGVLIASRRRSVTPLRT